MPLPTAAHRLSPALACTRKDKWAQTIKAPQFWQSEEGAATVRAAEKRAPWTRDQPFQKRQPDLVHPLGLPR